MALETIVARKREEVRARKERRSPAEIRDGLVPSRRSLAEALRVGRTGYILECKKASPSRGLIRTDFDPVAIATTYARYADAISVLADERFFQGSLDFVRRVSETVSLPVLCKDFILEPYQVYEARRYGADAVLLMLSVLDDNEYSRCLEAANEVGLDALTEVHDRDELGRAVALGAEIIGINNRNLKTLEVDLATSRILAPEVPGDRIVVIESGISGHREVLELSALCDGFLVGSSLMSRPDLDRACRELVYGRVKVCGLTRPADAELARNGGAVYGGLIFADVSPRYVTHAQAEKVRGAAPIDFVGVFVNETVETVAALARNLDLGAVQLHGDEDGAYLSSLRGRLPEGCEVWKAVRVGSAPPVLEGIASDRVVLDTASAKARGGTGERFDWSLVHGMDLGRVLLAGGLTPSTAAAADRLNPYGLDVSSGVEIRPGIKSMALVGAFFNELRGGRKESDTR